MRRGVLTERSLSGLVFQRGGRGRCRGYWDRYFRSQQNLRGVLHYEGKRHRHRPCNLPVDHRRTWWRSRCRQSRRRRRSLQLFASSLSQHCAPAVSTCAIASKCKWLDECGLNPLIDVTTLHEDVIPSFQTARYHQSSEFDRAMTDMNISDREASISTSKLGWTSC